MKLPRITIYPAIQIFTVMLFFILSLNSILATRHFLMREEEEEEDEEGYIKEGHADEAFEWWYAQRALPGGTIPPDGLINAYRYVQDVLAKKNSARKNFSHDNTRWESIGPDNVGGRVLSLAIDPESTDVLWAGSASGGLWKSTSGGKGASAWQYVNSGFPLLSVSAIAIDPVNPDNIFIGTGEISGYNLGQVGTPGARTTYGLGILRSTNRGKTWDTTGLNWKFSQNRSVQKIVINPLNPNVLYTATSEGTYKSTDRGVTWFLADTVKMVMDVGINPIDTGEVYIACGQRNTWTNPGIYKSINAGSTWTKLGSGLPTTNFGRTSLAISPSNPAIVYASVANAVSHALDGLYRTTDHGATWTKMSTTNYLSGQGWYDNIMGVDPSNAGSILCAGLDIYKSTDGGATLIRKSDWTAGYGGVVPANGPEGTQGYAHADHHAIAYDPKNPQRVFFGTDGGVFESTNGGETFAGRNGGFITSQFYNGFANSDQDSLIALGGTQDNGTLKYEGSSSWNKVYGGDGGWCAIDPLNKKILYEEYVYLTIAKSTNGGNIWSQIYASRSDSSNFIAPFVVAPSNGSVLYGGTKKIIKSTNGGNTWFETNNKTVLNGTNISCISVSFTSADTVITATGQRTAPLFEIFCSTNGGVQWTKSGSTLPNRYPTDITFDPNNSAIAYVVYSGYGSPHIFKSTDAGLTWNDISTDFPDVPAQSVVVDPAHPQSIYVGTDLGVFRTTNSGTHWEEYNEGMPVAMILDIGISLQDRRLRAATFGNGAYQRKLPLTVSGTAIRGTVEMPSLYVLEQNFPNPFNPSTTINYSVPRDGIVELVVTDASGKNVTSLMKGYHRQGKYSAHWDASSCASGVYFCTLRGGTFSRTIKMILMR
jgi:photosystem II stability/assembly factor-like uncharacterized protein